MLTKIISNNSDRTRVLFNIITSVVFSVAICSPLWYPRAGFSRVFTAQCSPSLYHDV